MIIYNTAQLECMFRQYNKDYFDGTLPIPKFEIIDSFKYFGYFYSSIFNNTTTNPLIQISGNWEYKDHQFRSIFVHEMIHYYLAYTGKDIESGHGVEFKRMAHEFNRKYGLNITETINYNEYTRRKGTSKIKYWLSQLF